MEVAVLAVVRGDDLGLGDGPDRPPGPLDLDVPHAGQAHDALEGIERGVLLEVELDVLERVLAQLLQVAVIFDPLRARSSAAGAPGR